MRKKIKTIRKNLLRFKTSAKKKKSERSQHTAAPLLEWVSIVTCDSLISTWNLIQEKKKRKKKKGTALRSPCVGIKNGK